MGAKVDVIVLGNIYQANPGGIDKCYVRGREYTVTQKFYRDHQVQLKLVEKKKSKGAPENDNDSETEGGEG